MDKSSGNAESIISSQMKQLARYESRMKDLVAAYKSLLKEKEALEASVAALTSSASVTSVPDVSVTTECSDKNSGNVDKQQHPPPPPSPTQQNTTDDELKMQISTVMNSLAILSAEKSKMEASFQADKRQLRQDLQDKDKVITDLQEKLKSTVSQCTLQVEKAKSKLIVERHDREKETNDHMLMVRELQKLLSDERHLRDNLEMQLNDLKTQFSQNDNNGVRIRELTAELEQAKQKIKDHKSTTGMSSTCGSSSRQNTMSEGQSNNILKHLQNEIVSLKQQHAIAIRTEQKRAHQAEEQYKRLSVVHEDRVANLESRLAELSATVGTYDRMRQFDQENIFKLKEKIAQFEVGGGVQAGPSAVLTNVSGYHWDVPSLIDEIMHLKKILLIENAKLANSHDLSKIFAPSNTDHSDCLDAQEKLRMEFEQYKRSHENNYEMIEVQRNHIKNLQSKVQVLNRNIDEQEQELKNKSIEYTTEIKSERIKWKDIISSMEMEFRGKAAELEQQLQKQRERSLTLLEEKENEIKMLKSSFDMFAPNGSTVESADGDNKEQQKMHFRSALNANGSSTGSRNSCAATNEYHMLHYVHELSRKEVEITALRKSKHAAESSLRQVLQDKVTSQEELHDKIIILEETVDRLKRCQSREGANLEYLKNVVLNYLVSTDMESKRHMVNAIAAVLKFSPTESKLIMNDIGKR